MTQIIARGSRDDGTVNLYARLYKRPTLNKTVALGITITNQDWTFVESVLKSAEQAQKMGSVVTLRDSLAQKLWDIKITLDAMILAGNASAETAKTVINDILREDLMEEMVHIQEQAVKKEEEEKRMTLIDWIREFIRQCESGERLKRKSTRMITPGTIKSYRGTLSQIEEYEKVCHRKLGFDDVTIDFYEDWKRFFIKKDYSPNTIGRHIRNLKIFMFAADDMKLTTSQEFKSSRFTADREDVENVYLTDERVSQMYEFNPTNRRQLENLIAQAPVDEQDRLRELTEKVTSRKLLEEAKDIFVVGCLTGQRVSDYKRIGLDMIEVLRDGRQYIRLEQEKTGKEVYLPIDERVPLILKKYGGQLPKIYDQHLNERIKIVGRLLGWTEDAGLTERHGLMEIKSQKKFYECIKTHTARRTFATNAYKRGVSLSSIMAVTGHSSEQMLRKYLKLDNKERAILAAAEFEKLKSV